jgi:purine-nucleoside phosphorylase
MKTINNTAQFLRDKGFTGDIGVILGTGLGNLIKEVVVEKEIFYEDIPEFPVSTVESHHGKLIKGKIGGKTALIMQGRFHYYEGYSLREITFPVRVLYALGIKHLLVSNAAGAVNLDYQKGH